MSVLDLILPNGILPVLDLILFELELVFIPTTPPPLAFILPPLFDLLNNHHKDGDFLGDGASKACNLIE